jgi:wyosine [tRNA(Phe)-imidazoG37] synthetase (radical SAM superfamily)
VHLDRLRVELEATVGAAVGGELFQAPPFDRVPEPGRVIRDLAFSGDGEPTASPHLAGAVRITADVRRRFGLENVKIVLLTNCAFLDRPAVRDALSIMDANNGEIWCKLDAGTEAFFCSINRPKAPLRHVLDNILDVARSRPIVIQSLWMNVAGSPPPDNEIDAFADRLREIIDGGGRIRLVQVYTIARPPAESSVTPLSDDALAAVARRVALIVNVPVTTYGG